MNVSLARENLGSGPRATSRCAGRYKVGATADVSGRGVALVPNVCVQTSLSKLSWELASSTHQGKAVRTVVGLDMRLKSNGLNQSL